MKENALLAVAIATHALIQLNAYNVLLPTFSQKMSAFKIVLLVNTPQMVPASHAAIPALNALL